LDEFEGQGHHEQIHHFGSLFLFGKTSLASNYGRVCNRAAHYIFTLWFILSSHIHGLLKIQVAKNRHLGTIVPTVSLELRHVSTIGKILVKQ